MIAAAKQLAAEAFVLETLQHTDDWTPLQKHLRDTNAKRVVIDRDKSTQTLLQALRALPDDLHKMDTINAFNKRFEQVPDIRVDTKTLTQTLAAQLLEVDKAIQ